MIQGTGIEQRRLHDASVMDANPGDGDVVDERADAFFTSTSCFDAITAEHLKG